MRPQHPFLCDREAAARKDAVGWIYSSCLINLDKSDTAARCLGERDSSVMWFWEHSGSLWHLLLWIPIAPFMYFSYIISLGKEKWVWGWNSWVQVGLLFPDLWVPSGKSTDWTELQVSSWENGEWWESSYLVAFPQGLKKITDEEIPVKSQSNL